MNLPKKEEPILPPKKMMEGFVPQKDKKMTTQRFFEKVNSMLNEKIAVVADIGEVLFGASSLVVSHHHFISPAFYCSMGLAIPGALGVGMAKPELRPVVLVGDGAFQMSVSELSSHLENKLNTIVFVLNNKGYTTERFLLDGKFNNIRNWNYHAIPQLMGGGTGYFVETEEQLEAAVSAALKSKELAIVNVSVDPTDISTALRRMVENLSKRV